jgi:hypothetical protein
MQVRVLSGTWYLSQVPLSTRTCIRQHTSAYVSIRQHTYAEVREAYVSMLTYEVRGHYRTINSISIFNELPLSS